VSRFLEFAGGQAHAFIGNAFVVGLAALLSPQGDIIVGRICGTPKQVGHRLKVAEQDARYVTLSEFDPFEEGQTA